MGMIDKLKRADEAYYAGKPVMSDADYDSLRRTAKRQHPDHSYFKKVGAVIPGTQKVAHIIPMGSLDNLFTSEEFFKWHTGVANKAELVMEHKFDGLSVELIYIDGYFEQAITRGDGIEGEDVTENVRRSTQIVMTLPRGIAPAGRMSVRAECMLALSDFEKYFKDMENARNAAAGTLRRQSGERAEHLQYVAFDVLCKRKFKSEMDKVEFLLDSGFVSADPCVVNTSDEAWEYVIALSKERDALEFEIDGAVAKVNNLTIQKELGERDMRPRSQRAIKFKPRGANTTLDDVVIQVGRTGAITPVAKVAPVRVGGVTIRSVTLHNFDEVERLDIAIGDTVEVVRAADVIPKITRRISKGKRRKEIERPEVCPVCNSDKLYQDDVILYCTNRDCEAQTFYTVMNWIKKRNILYLGENIARSAFDAGLIESPIDIYKVDEAQLAALKVGKTKLGKTRARKIEGEIDKSRTMTLAEFIGCLGIRLCGRTIAKKLVKELGVSTIPEFLACISSGNKKLLTRAGGIGGEIAESVHDYFMDDNNRENALEFDELITIRNPEESGSGTLLGKTVCFTGDAGVKRSKLQQLVEEQGGVVKTSVTKDLDILVIADPNSQSTKARKARAQNTKLMDPDSFLDLVGWEF